MSRSSSGHSVGEIVGLIEGWVVGLLVEGEPVGCGVGEVDGFAVGD